MNSTMSSHLGNLCQSCVSDVFNPDCFARLYIGTDSVDNTTGILLAKSLSILSEQCVFCDLIESLLLEANANRDESISIRAYATSIRDGLRSDVALLFLDAGDHACQRYMIHADPSDPAAESISTRPPDAVVDSDSTFDVVRSWIKDCDQNHEQCRRKMAPLPTRVLDVSNDQVRLFITNGINASYTALSYCWGAPQPRMLTKSNLAAYTQAIDIDTLPASIRDAVTVVRKVGQRYLWVDSLCIIQDSPEDKVHEISRMGSLYQESYLTIQAAGATTCRDGFLHRTKRSSTTPKEVVLPYLGPMPGSMILRRWTAETDYDPAEDPASSRAWIYQERVLSARLLIYPSDPHPLQWQCGEVRTSNGGPLPHDDEYGSERLGTNLQSPPQPIIRSGRGDELEESGSGLDTAARLDLARRWLWYRVVQNYSSRALGDPGDKLPAIAGVAMEFARVRGPDVTGPYCAGLWRNDMPLELLWSVLIVPRDRGLQLPPAPGDEGEEEGDGDRGNGDTTKRQYRAPSWSWAAIDCQVLLSTQRPTYPHDFDILECHIAPEVPGVDFGRISAAHLIVRALLRPATWNKQSRVLRTNGGGNDGGDAVAPIIGIGRPDAYRAHGIISVWCMPVLRAERYPSYMDTGLVLEKAGHDYRRVGVCTLTLHGYFDGCSQQTFRII